MAAALASDAGFGPGLTCEILSVPWPVSWPDTSHALNAVLADTTFRPALFVPPSAARLKTATWSPGVLDVDFALIATPEDTVTATGSVMDHPPLQLGSSGYRATRSDDVGRAPHSSGIPALRRPSSRSAWSSGRIHGTRRRRY